MPTRQWPSGGSAKQQEAIRLARRGSALLGEELLDEAEQAFLSALELGPGLAPAWFDLGLIYKRRRRWSEALRCNRQASTIDGQDSATWWNLGIAATALRDWSTARRAWRRYGIPIQGESGPIEADFGLTPVRINPDSKAEVVWCRRVDPARAIIINIPLPESGHRWGDCVLHDGAPNGERISGGRTYHVFDELERWEASSIPTLQVNLHAPGPDDADALEALFEEQGLAAEDWTANLRTLCRACSEGSPHPEHEPLTTEWSAERAFGLAAQPATADELLGRWAAAAPGRHCSQPEVVA
jgi:tetratricopeptide (TPR) repeat protein